MIRQNNVTRVFSLAAVARVAVTITFSPGLGCVGLWLTPVMKGPGRVRVDSLGRPGVGLVKRTAWVEPGRNPKEASGH
jgi:hypothetical protein